MLNETSETPIAFFFGESMMSSVVDIQAGIVRVPEDERKLNTAAPVVGNLISFEAVFKINGALVDIVTMWEEQNAPVKEKKCQQDSERQRRDGSRLTKEIHLLGRWDRVPSCSNCASSQQSMCNRSLQGSLVRR